MKMMDLRAKWSNFSRSKEERRMNYVWWRVRISDKKTNWSKKVHISFGIWDFFITTMPTCYMWKIKWSILDFLQKMRKNGLKRFFRNYKNDPESWKHFRTVLEQLHKPAQHSQKLPIGPIYELMHCRLGFHRFWLFWAQIWPRIEPKH